MSHTNFFSTIIIMFIVCVQLSTAYSVVIPINSTGTQTLTNFKTDIGNCPCNITDLCDNFCCCDTVCTAQLLTGWETNEWCRNTPTGVERFCGDLGTRGYSAFEDLGCVIYSNRGSIGYFYDLPNLQTVVYPISNKFAFRNTNTQQIAIDTQSQRLQIKIDSIQKPFPIRTSGIGQSCTNNLVKILEPGSYSYSCKYPIRSQVDCENINADLEGTSFQFCTTTACGSVINNAFTVTNATWATGPPSSCTGVITSMTISYTLGYQNNSYLIQDASFTFGTSDISSRSAQITTNILVTLNGVQNSGNPGYIIGKPLQYSQGGIYNLHISNTDPGCEAASTPNTALLDIKFGINKTYTCTLQNNDACTTKKYVDSIANGIFKLKKYGLISNTEQIQVIGETADACIKQIITLNILYSSAGWLLDPQYYILAAKISTQTPINTLIPTKYFSVNWIYVSPEDIVSPPTNYFYEYFSYLWYPLKSKISNYADTFGYAVHNIGIFIGLIAVLTLL